MKDELRGLEYIKWAIGIQIDSHRHKGSPSIFSLYEKGEYDGEMKAYHYMLGLTDTLIRLRINKRKRR